MRLRMRHRGRLYDLPFDHVVMVQEEQTGVLTLGVPGSGIRVRFGANLTQDELDLIRRTIVRSADEGLPSLDLDEIAKEARMGRKDEPRRFPSAEIAVALGLLTLLCVITSFRSPFDPVVHFLSGAFGNSTAGALGAGVLVALFYAVVLAWHALAYGAVFVLSTAIIQELRARRTGLVVTGAASAAALAALLLEWRFAPGPLRPGFLRDFGADLAGVLVLAVWMSISCGLIRLPKRTKRAQAQS